MKCLEKDRARRYDTASGLAADLERYLVHEPILARPPAAAYRVQKWIRRHQVQFVALVAVAAVLLVATAVSAWQALRATRAQRAFQEQAEIAQSVKDFLLKQLVGSGDAWEGRSFDTNNRALVQRIARELEGQFTHQPLVEAEIRQALGVTMNWMDDFPESLAQTEKAWALRKRHLGPAHSDTLQSASEAGYNLYNLGRHQEGDRVLDEAIAEARAASQIATHGAADALSNRGWKLAFDGRPAEAMPFLREALTSFVRALGDDHSRTSAARSMVAAVTGQLGDCEEARRLYEAGLNDCLRFHGADHIMTASFLKGYALFLIQEGRYEEAIEKLTSAIAIWKQAPAHGPDNLYTLESEGYLAAALEKKGEVEEAIRRNRDLHRRYAPHLRNYRSFRKVRELAAFFVRHRLYADATAAYADLKQALTEIPPQRASEFELLLQSTAATGGWEAAGDLCRAQLNAFPDSLSTWLQKAQVFQYLEDEENYGETVKRVLALPATLVSTNEQHLPIEIAGLGPVKLSPGQRAELDARIQSLEAELPNGNPSQRQWGYRALVQFYLCTGELERALANLERAESDPASPDASTLYLKAICLKRLQQDEKARAALEEADSLAAAQIALEPGFENFVSPGQLYQLVACRREAQAEIERR
ncbi:MAG TPA: tetratricopeptide repeat protein [Verrucomicrobiota bacterium]|nr:tetratricopeptide repeat protein [Verrucomicrobiota bacterium]